jgi:hypothetical protein
VEKLWSVPPSSDLFPYVEISRVSALSELPIQAITDFETLQVGLHD